MVVTLGLAGLADGPPPGGATEPPVLAHPVDVRTVCRLPRFGDLGRVVGADGGGSSSIIGGSAYWVFGDTWVDRNDNGVSISFEQDEIHLRAADDFRDDRTQGYHGWRYQECATSRARDIGRGCRDLDRFATDGIPDTGAWRHSNLRLEPNTLVWSAGVRPPSKARRAVSRTWIAPADGHLALRGAVVDLDKGAECAGIGDGVDVAVFSGPRTKVWPAGPGWQHVEGVTEASLSVDVDVTAGQAVQVVVHRGAGSFECDSTRVAPRLEFTW